MMDLRIVSIWHSPKDCLLAIYTFLSFCFRPVRIVLEMLCFPLFLRRPPPPEFWHSPTMLASFNPNPVPMGPKDGFVDIGYPAWRRHFGKVAIDMKSKLRPHWNLLRYRQHPPATKVPVPAEWEWFLPNAWDILSRHSTIPSISMLNLAQNVGNVADIS